MMNGTSGSNRRYQSQPRPRRQETPRPQNSFENWEIHTKQSSHSRQHYPAGSDRRSKSSMRPQSAKRQPQPQPHYQDQQQVRKHPSAAYEEYMNGNGAGNRTASRSSAARAASTGRVRKSSGDALYAADQLLQQHGQRMGQTSANPSYARSSSSTARKNRQSYPLSNHNKSLTDDLEEEQFFAELDTEKVSTRHAAPKTPRQAPSLNLTPQPTQSKRDQSSIPKVIRAASNPRSQRLPPPTNEPMTPTVQRNVAAPVLQSSLRQGSIGNAAAASTRQIHIPQMQSKYQPLSPRTISKLGRHEVELECQNLVQELKNLEKKLHGAQTELENQKPRLASAQRNGELVGRLQEDLQRLTHEMHVAYTDNEQRKRQMEEEYQAKLRDQATKLHRVQEHVDEAKADLSNTRQQHQRLLKQLEDAQTRCRQKDATVGDLKAKEDSLEMELSEVKTVKVSLLSKLERKKHDMAKMQQEIKFLKSSLKSTSDEKDATYEKRIASLNEQLQLTNDDITHAHDQIDKQAKDLADKDHAIMLSKKKDAQQAELILDQQKAIDALRQEVEESLTQRKDDQSSTTVKMQTMVVKHADEIQKFEARIKSMQEQLRHQTDRHHAELQERNKQNQRDLEDMKEAVVDQVRRDESQAAEKLRRELESLQLSYDQTRQDLSHRIKEAETKERSSCEEFERKDMDRSRELEDMRNRLDTCMKDIADKDKRIKELGMRVQIEDNKAREFMAEMESKHITEMRDRDDAIEAQRKQFRAIESKLKTEVAKQEAEFAELEQARQDSIRKLEAQLQQANDEIEDRKLSSTEASVRLEKKLEQTKTSYKTLQDEVLEERLDFEKTKDDLQSTILKLESKVRASETSLKQKRSTIEQLEHKLHLAASNSMEERQKLSEMEGLRRQIEEALDRVEKEKSKVTEKDATIDRLQDQILGLKQKVKMLSELEELAKEMKMRLLTIEEEKKKQISESHRFRKDCEELTAKLVETEHQLSIEKEDNQSEIKKKDRMFNEMQGRLESRVQSLEHQVNDLLADKSATEKSLESAERDIAKLTTEKTKKEKEMANLRSDYAEVSALVEEHLHVAATKSSLEERLDRKEKSFAESQKQSRQQIADLEAKIENAEQQKVSLEASIERLQGSVKELQKEKAEQAEELSQARIGLEDVRTELAQTKRNYSITKDGTTAELQMKDKYMREVVQKYAKEISELQSKLEEETQTKSEVEDKLQSARGELEDKQRHTQDLIQRNTRKVMELEADVEQRSMKNEELNFKLKEAQEELENKRREMKDAIGRYSAEVSQLEDVKKDHQGVKQQIAATSAELDRKDKQIAELRQKIPSLLAELDTKTKECDEHKQKIGKVEGELRQKVKDLNASVTSYSEQVSSLEAKLHAQTYAQKHTEQEAVGARSQLDKLKSEIDNLQHEVSGLRTKLDQANRARDVAKQKADQIVKEMDDKRSEVRHFEMEKIEFETRLSTQSRAKDELRTKVSELTSKLERSERALREMEDRKNMQIVELEQKLDRDTNTKHKLQEALDMIRYDAAGVSTEADALRAKIASLEEETKKSRDADSGRGGQLDEMERQLQTSMAENERFKKEIAHVEDEKQQILLALENMIPAMSERDEDIAYFREELDRKEGELEHAKVLATRAVETAKTLREKFNKEIEEKQASYGCKIDDLKDALNDLTAQREMMERKMNTLERELKEKNFECKRLTDQLRQIDGRGLGDDISTFSNNSATFSTSSRRLKETLRQYDSKHQPRHQSKPQPQSQPQKFFDNDDNTQATFTVSRSYSSNPDSVNPPKNLNFDLESFSPESARSGSEFGSYLEGQARGQESNDSHDSAMDESLGSAHESNSRGGGESLSSRQSRRSGGDLRSYVRSKYTNNRRRATGNI